MSAPFQRGLSKELLDDLLRGACSTVLRAGMRAGLDVRLRDNYLNLYLQGRSLGRICGRRRGPAKLEVHHKYLDSDRIGDFVGKRNGDYRVFNVDHALATAYAGELDSIMRRALRYTGREESVEFQLLERNSSTSGVFCFDRQIQVPGIRRKLDLMALCTAPVQTLVAIEVKRDGDSRIQDVPKQLHEYLDIFDPGNDGLRGDVADSYRRVCAQLHTLGLPAPEPSDISTGMPVQGLVIVSDYNPKSGLLPRAHLLARQLARPIYLWQPSGGDLRIPPPADWIRMG